MNVGMLGAGTIATRLSETFVRMGGDVVTYAIASAFPEECPKFVEKYGWKKWYRTYEEVMEDPDVDIVYVAVPNPFHYELCKKALEHNKNIICEKPFCVNARQAKEIFDLAEEKKLFVTEAVWTNYMPSSKLIQQELDAGTIGAPVEAEIRLKSYILFKERLKSPELAGGALLDLGPYTFGIMLSHFGQSIRTMKPNFTYLDTGVDGSETIEFVYDSGLKVTLENSCCSSEDVRYCVIKGTDGRIVVEGTTNPKKITVFDRFGKVKKEVPVPEQISGYEYEFLACERCLKNGELECSEIPHSETLYTLTLMDRLRKIGGISFPCE